MPGSALELKVPPLLVALIAAAGMYAASHMFPSLGTVFTGNLKGVAALSLVGASLVIAGVAAFRAHCTTVDPLRPARATTIVRTGIYRFSRNPMYLGFVLILAAWAVLLNTVGALPGLPLFVIYMNRFQIRPEEQILAQRFGSDYLDYTRSVRRWL